ncbi:hypothetical protein ILYODFUR_028629 [Ilyodon furcidens]|uniref:Uncharacterized protein n=1 Tax=Ilyodon furcidens TaxID=33524 RepID=A0ABV0TDA9_9TELE
MSSCCYFCSNIFVTFERMKKKAISRVKNCKSEKFCSFHENEKNDPLTAWDESLIFYIQADLKKLEYCEKVLFIFSPPSAPSPFIGLSCYSHMLALHYPYYLYLDCVVVVFLY